MSKDDDAVNTEVEAGTTATESAPEEAQPEVVEKFDNGEYSQADLDAEETEEETKEESEEESEESKESEEPEEETQEPEARDDTEEEKPLAPKSVNRFQQLANENRELRERLNTLTAKEAQVATEQELLNQVNPDTGDYYTIAEAERAARLQYNESAQQQYAQERYQLEVQQNQQKISSEAQQALSEFPELDETSDKYDAEVAAEYDAALAQALILDQQGTPIGSYLSPYQLAKSIAGPARKAYERAKTLGQAEAQKATSRMLASADPSSSSHQAEKSFDKMTVSEQEAYLRKKGHDI